MAGLAGVDVKVGLVGLDGVDGAVGVDGLDGVDGEDRGVWVVGVQIHKCFLKKEEKKETK